MNFENERVAVVTTFGIGGSKGTRVQEETEIGREEVEGALSMMKSGKARHRWNRC